MMRGWRSLPRPTLARVRTHVHVGNTACYAGRLVVVEWRDGEWAEVTPMGERGPLQSETEIVEVGRLERLR